MCFHIKLHVYECERRNLWLRKQVFSISYASTQRQAWLIQQVLSTSTKADQRPRERAGSNGAMNSPEVVSLGLIVCAVSLTVSFTYKLPNLLILKL